MNKETIEKAAKEYAKDKYGGKNAKEWAIAQIHSGRDGFIEGAQWRISSVWHSTDELPKYSGFLAVLMSNRLMETMHYSAGIKFHEMTLKGYTSWAYISDLIPERKEETNGGR